MTLSFYKRFAMSCLLATSTLVAPAFANDPARDPHMVLLPREPLPVAAAPVLEMEDVTPPALLKVCPTCTVLRFQELPELTPCYLLVRMPEQDEPTQQELSCPQRLPLTPPAPQP